MRVSTVARWFQVPVRKTKKLRPPLDCSQGLAEGLLVLGTAYFSSWYMGLPSEPPKSQFEYVTVSLSLP